MNPQIQLRKATQLFIVVACYGLSPALNAKHDQGHQHKLQWPWLVARSARGREQG